MAEEKQKFSCFELQNTLREKWKKSSFNRKRYSVLRAIENKNGCCRTCNQSLTNNSDANKIDYERRCITDIGAQTQNIPATKEQIRSSELLNILSVIDKNHDFNSVDKNRLLFKSMFPDSKIADSYYMSETKLQYLLKFGLLDYAKRAILKDIRECPYSVHFDEVLLGSLHDQVQFDVYITYFSSRKQGLCTEYADSLFVSDNTPDVIAESIHSCLQTLKLNKNYMVRLSIRCVCDDILYERAILGFLKQQNLYTILDVIPCPQQIFNTAFSKLITTIQPVLDINQVIQDFDNFFLYAPCQKPVYPGLSELTKVVSGYYHSHVFNKWMSLEKVMLHLSKEWEGLSKYFLEILPGYEKTTQTTIMPPLEYKRIQNYLQDKVTILTIEFAIYIASHFLYFFEPLQGNNSMLPLLHTKVLELVNDLSNVFRLIEFNDNKPKSKRESISDKIDNIKDQKLHRKVCDFRIKFDILANQLSIVKKWETFKTFKDAMKQTTEYLLERLPLTHQLIFDVKYLYYESTLEKGAENAICRLAINFERILGEEKMKTIFNFDSNFAVVNFTSLVQNEYKLFEKENLLAEFVEQCDKKIVRDSDEKTKEKTKYRTDYFWSIIGNVTHKDGSFMFGQLSKLVQSTLTMFPLYQELQSGFETNIALMKSTSNSNITSDNLSAIRTVKEFINKSGGIENVKITDEILNACANAYTLYATYCLEKKNELLGTMKLFEEKQKEITKKEEKKVIDGLEKV